MPKNKKHPRTRRRSYAQIINPIHHLEHTIERLDRDNDKLEKRVYLLSIASVALTVLGILLAIISFRVH